MLTNLYSFEKAGRISEYSDLEFQQVEVTLGGSYHVSPALYLTAQATWEMFEDEDPWVYGDQDGTAYRGNVGLGYRF